MKTYWPAVAVCGVALLLPLAAHAQGAPATPRASAPSTPATPGAAAAPDAAADASDEAPSHDRATTRSKKESFTDYLWRKSDDAFHLGDYETAVKLHRSIELVDPSDVENYSVTAWLLWSMERGDEAVQLLERGIAANPKDPDMWDAAGQQFDLQKLTTRARDAYKQAVALTSPDDLKTPDGMMLRRRFAHATERTGDLNAGVTIWRSLVTDFPDEAVNKNNLARLEAEIAERDRKASGLIPTRAALIGGGAIFTTVCVPLAVMRLMTYRHARRSTNAA